MRVCTGGVPETWQLIGSMLDCKFLGRAVWPACNVSLAPSTTVSHVFTESRRGKILISLWTSSLTSQSLVC